MTSIYAVERLLLIIVVVAICLSLPLLVVIRYLKTRNRDSSKLRAVVLLMLCLSIGAWTLIARVYVPYINHLAPTISRHNTLVSIQSPGAALSLWLHLAMSVFLMAFGTWFSIRIWRQGNEP